MVICVDEWEAAYIPEPYPLGLLRLVGSPCRLHAGEFPRVSTQPPTTVAVAIHPEPHAAGDAEPVPMGDELLPVTLNFLPTYRLRVCPDPDGSRMLTLLPPQHNDPATYMLTLIKRLPLKLFPLPTVTQSELGSPRKKP